MYATTTATPERQEELHNFFHKAEHYDWEDFDPLKNSAQVYALQCPDQNISMLFVRDPFELFDGDFLENWEPLQQEVAQTWQTFLAKDKWAAFT